MEYLYCNYYMSFYYILFLYCMLICSILKSVLLFTDVLSPGNAALPVHAEAGTAANAGVLQRHDQFL